MEQRNALKKNYGRLSGYSSGDLLKRLITQKSINLERVSKKVLITQD